MLTRLYNYEVVNVVKLMLIKNEEERGNSSVIQSLFATQKEDPVEINNYRSMEKSEKIIEEEEEEEEKKEDGLQKTPIKRNNRKMKTDSVKQDLKQILKLNKKKIGLGSSLRIRSQENMDNSFKSFDWVALN